MNWRSLSLILSVCATAILVAAGAFGPTGGAFDKGSGLGSPASSPSAAPGGTPSPCPVTVPNGSPPPGLDASPDLHGNGALWVTLPPDGIVRISPGQVGSDGWLSEKFPWWRGESGQLAITGQRLDGDAPSPRASIPEGYGDTGFQSSGIDFPTEGCWEITGRVGEASLTFVVQVVKLDETRADATPPSAS